MKRVEIMEQQRKAVMKDYTVIYESDGFLVCHHVTAEDPDRAVSGLNLDEKPEDVLVYSGHLLNLYEN